MGCHSGQLQNWIESLIVVNPGAPRETSEDPASLVAIKCPIREEPVREDPLIDDNIGATGSRNKFPCPIAHLGPVLLHSRASIRIDEGGTSRGRDGGWWFQGSCGDEGEPVTR
jgi:hypothetical protein